MKKIVCLIENLSPGGAERQLVYLASNLKKEGYDVEVWTYYPGDFYLPLLNDAGVNYRYITEAQNKGRRFFVLRRELKAYAPDIVIAYLNTACIVACIIKALGTRFKLIVSERNTTQSLNLRERIKFFCYRYADWIVPNSETQCEFIMKEYPHLREKVKVITNYVDLEKFQPMKNKKGEDSTKVVVAARIMPQKNPMSLIRAVRILKDKGVKIVVDWYGNQYDEDYKNKCVDLIEELQVSDIFHFCPTTSDIASIYPRYDVFCLPSIYEGFSNVICEAMCCGLPILCSDVADNPLIAEEGRNAILFNPNNVDEIVNAFSSFVNMTGIQKKSYALSSRSIAENKFSKQVFVTKYVNAIEA